MEAENAFGSGRFFDAQTVGAEGDAAICTDFERGAHTPDARPPGTTGGGAQDGSVFFFGGVPGARRGLAQFAMDFVRVAMVAPGVALPVGFSQFRDFFTGETGRPSARPALVFALDFAFGLAGLGRSAG